MRRGLGAASLLLAVLAGSGGLTSCARQAPGPGVQAEASTAAEEDALATGASTPEPTREAPPPDAPTAAAPTPTPTAQPPVPAAPATPVSMFTSSVSEITPELAERMHASWRPGCPVDLADLRYVTGGHVDFDGGVSTGELVVHTDVADAVVEVFAALFEARYPIRSMRLIDDFDADDAASMAADNTSAFNCRAVTGGSAWSEHAYGRAIDLNPVENPYVRGEHLAPAQGEVFRHRPDLPGVIHAGDAVVAAFAAAGWAWGGYWDSPVDYQHFSVTGR